MKVFAKLFLEFMPLLLFFIASAVWEGDFMRPTAVLVVMTALAFGITWWIYHQPALMAIINAATGVVAGSATLISHEPAFVMMKPTIIGGIYAIILAIALVTGRPLFRILLGKTLHLTEEGWRVLTWLWLFYFMFVSGLNEYIRLHLTFEQWALFKVAGLVPLTLLYAWPQIKLLKKYRPPEETTPKPASASKARIATGASDTAMGASVRQPVS